MSVQQSYIREENLIVLTKEKIGPLPEGVTAELVEDFVLKTLHGELSDYVRLASFDPLYIRFSLDAAVQCDPRLLRARRCSPISLCAKTIARLAIARMREKLDKFEKELEDAD